MNSSLLLVTGLVVVAFCLGAFYFIVMKNRVADAVSDDAGDGKYAPRDLLTVNELEFFGRLRHALPELQVFPQVALSAIIRPQGNGKATTAARNRIDRKVVDFAIYTTEFKLVCIVELDDKTHDGAKDVNRDKLVKSANITTLRWSSTAKPTVEEIRQVVYGVSARPPRTSAPLLHLVQERRRID